jgi:hypothetical protein
MISFLWVFFVLGNLIRSYFFFMFQKYFKIIFFSFVINICLMFLKYFNILILKIIFKI